MPYVSPVLSGLLFGMGLTISGMVDSDKVLAFLDPVGAWDPSLALVMSAALAVFAAVNAFVAKRAKPLRAPAFLQPASRTIDRALPARAAVFGIGWRLAGYCPGPGLAALVFNPREAAVFLPAVLLGGWWVDRVTRAARN